MTQSLILKRAPNRLEPRRLRRGRERRHRRPHLPGCSRAAGAPMDVVERPQRRLSPGDPRLRADARRGDGGIRQELATVSERCSLEWDTSYTGLVVGWRWWLWCRVSSSSSTALTRIAGGLSMSLPSAVLFCVGCLDGPANIFWLANKRRASDARAGDHCHLAGPHRRHSARVSMGIFVMTCGRRHRVQAQGLALPLRSVAGLT
jgi:hypothetical protein